MTTEIQSVLEYADYRFVLNNQKQLLKEKTLQHLRHTHNGGSFNIDSTLISMTRALIDGDNTTIYLMDTNNNPIEIKDAHIFLETIESIESIEFIDSIKSMQFIYSIDSLTTKIL